MSGEYWLIWSSMRSSRVQEYNIYISAHLRHRILNCRLHCCPNMQFPNLHHHLSLKMDNIPRLEQLLEYVTFQLHSYDTLLSVRTFNTRPIIPSRTMLSTIYSIANLFQLHWGIETTVVLFMFATYYLENKLIPEFMRPHHADVIEYLSSQPTICIFVALLIIASKFNFDRFIPLSYWSGALAIQTAELVDVERNLLIKFMYDFTIGTGGNRGFERWLGKLFEEKAPQTLSTVSTLKIPVMAAFAEVPPLGRYHNPTHSSLGLVQTQAYEL